MRQRAASRSSLLPTLARAPRLFPRRSRRTKDLLSSGSPLLENDEQKLRDQESNQSLSREQRCNMRRGSLKAALSLCLREARWCRSVTKDSGLTCDHSGYSGLRPYELRTGAIRPEPTSKLARVAHAPAHSASTASRWRRSTAAARTRPSGTSVL